MFAAILRKDSRMSFLLKLLETGTISILTTSDSRSKKEGEVLKNIISDSKHGIYESRREVNKVNCTLISKAPLKNTRAEYNLNPQTAVKGETRSLVFPDRLKMTKHSKA